MMTSERNDDLTQIPGIGAARQQLLRDRFNIYTYQDLVNTTNGQFEKIRSQLKENNVNITQSMLQKWRDQANELTRSDPQSLRTENETNKAIVDKENNSLAREDGWKPFASFVVEFQSRLKNNQVEECRTAVHHMEADTSKDWEGIQSKKLCAWMLDQIRDLIVLELEEDDLDEEEPTESPPVEKKTAKVKITRVSVFQPPQSDMPSQQIETSKPFKGPIKAGRTFSLDVDFELVGPVLGDISSQKIHYLAQSYVYDYATKETTFLGDTGPKTLEPDKHEHKFRLKEVSLQKGTYRMWILVKPQAPFAIPDYIEVPSFQVV